MRRARGKKIGGSPLANIKSQIKRNRQNDKRRLRNRGFRGTARSAVKEARLAIESGDKEQAKIAVAKAIKTLDKAAEKGVIHRNNAARRKSRLMTFLAAIKPQAKVAQKSEAEAAEGGGSKRAAAKKPAAAKKLSGEKSAKEKPASGRAAKKAAEAEKTTSTKKTAAKKAGTRK